MSIEEKQIYLRNEILDQGYNGNDFAAFLGERLEQVDLEEIEYSRLKEVYKLI